MVFSSYELKIAIANLTYIITQRKENMKYQPRKNNTLYANINNRIDFNIFNFLFIWGLQT
jgi:hypothetical protein